MPNIIVSGFCIAFSFACISACSDDDGSNDPSGERSASVGMDCAELCARSVGCAADPLDDCLSSCELSASLCPAEAAVAVDCARSRPDSDFHCDESDLTVLDDGVCSSERDELFACVGDADL